MNKVKKIGDLTLNEAFGLYQKHCNNNHCDKCPIRDCKFVIYNLGLNFYGELISKEDLDKEIEVEEDED